MPLSQNDLIAKVNPKTPSNVHEYKPFKVFLEQLSSDYPVAYRHSLNSLKVDRLGGELEFLPRSIEKGTWIHSSIVTKGAGQITNLAWHFEPVGAEMAVGPDYNLELLTNRYSNGVADLIERGIEPVFRSLELEETFPKLRMDKQHHIILQELLGQDLFKKVISKLSNHLHMSFTDEVFNERNRVLRNRLNLIGPFVSEAVSAWLESKPHRHQHFFAWEGIDPKSAPTYETYPNIVAWQESYYDRKPIPGTSVLAGWQLVQPSRAQDEAQKPNTLEIRLAETMPPHLSHRYCAAMLNLCAAITSDSFTFPHISKRDWHNALYND